MRSKMMAVLTGFACCALVASAAEVTFTLSSAQDGTTVNAGATIDWSISVEETDSTGSAGIALAVVDLVQDGANPESMDVPPGSEGSIAGVMASNFNRPGGISNPGEGGASTGFIGVQRGTAGAMNLIQIGGGQNTFGQAGTVMGTNATVAGGVGQSGAVLVVSGSLTAPATEGDYTFSLANALANTLDSVASLPNFSPVSAATTVATSSITVTVGPSTTCALLGDMNCSGGVDAFDIDPFISALLTPAQYAIDYPDCDFKLADINGGGAGAPDAFDIDPFIACVLNAGCPVPIE